MQHMQRTAGHCNTPVTHCNTLQPRVQRTLAHAQTATHCNTQHTATHCNTLQHTALHCNTLQYTTYCNTLHCTATHFTTQHHTATYCNTLHCTATHFTTQHHTATQSWKSAVPCANAPARECVGTHTLFEPPLESDWISNFQITHSVDISICITNAHTCTHTQCLLAPLDAWLSSWCFRSLLNLWYVWLKHTYTHTSVFSRPLLMAHWVREF